MRKVFFLFALFLFAANVFSQEQAEQNVASEAESVESAAQDSDKDSRKNASVDYAAKIAGAENLPIARFDISGLKRTKRSYMDNLLAEFNGKPVSVPTIKMIETTLQAQNLFDQINVSAKALDDGQAAVEISFKEKWSLLPLPVGYYTDGSYALGLFLMDMNTFGQHCTTILGGIYSPNTIMGAGVFRKPPAKKGKLGFSIAANVSRSKHTFADSKNIGVYTYKNFYSGARANILFKPTNATTASVGAGYSFFEPIDSPNVRRTNQWSAAATWGISSSSWNGYFLSVNSFDVGAEFLFSDNPEQRFAQTFEFGGQAQRPIYERIRLMTAARGFFSNDLLETNFVGRAKSGVTLLPSSFATNQIFGLFSGLEVAVAKSKFGMLSVYALYEVAVARDWDKTFYACHGPEAGVRIYLAKVAFPAFAFGASYNINEDRFQYSFSGGASF